MSQVVIDANTLLRFLLDDIKSQADQVEELLREAEEGKEELLVPQIVIFEIAFALDKYYHFPKQKVVRSIKSILTMKYLQIQDREVFKSAIEFFAQKNLSLADCFLSFFAKQNQADLFSFDRNLKKLMSNPSHPIKDS